MKYRSEFLAACLVLSLIYNKCQWDQISKLSIPAPNPQSQQQDLGGGIVRSGSSTQDANALNTSLSQNGVNTGVITQDTQRSGSQITGAVTNTSNSTGTNRTNIASTNTVPRRDPPQVIYRDKPCKCPPPPFCPGVAPTTHPEPATTEPEFSECHSHGYDEHGQVLKLNEVFGPTEVPFGVATFEAWKENPWSLETFKRSYRVTTVLAEDDEGKVSAYNSFQIQVNEEKHNIAINESRVVQTPKEPKWRSHVRPTLDASVGINSNGGVFPQINIGAFGFGYGTSRINPDWLVGGANLSFGLASNKFGIGATPFGYRVSNSIPAFEDLYAGPRINWEFGTGLNYGVFLGSGL